MASARPGNIVTRGHRPERGETESTQMQRRRHYVSPYVRALVVGRLAAARQKVVSTNVATRGAATVVGTLAWVGGVLIVLERSALWGGALVACGGAILWLAGMWDWPGSRSSFRRRVYRVIGDWFGENEWVRGFVGQRKLSVETIQALTPPAGHESEQRLLLGQIAELQQISRSPKISVEFEIRQWSAGWKEIHTLEASLVKSATGAGLDIYSEVLQAFIRELWDRQVQAYERSGRSCMEGSSEAR